MPRVPAGNGLGLSSIMGDGCYFTWVWRSLWLYRRIGEERGGCGVLGMAVCGWGCFGVLVILLLFVVSSGWWLVWVVWVSLFLYIFSSLRGSGARPFGYTAV